MATKKTTPQSRARARSAAKRGDAAQYARTESTRATSTKQDRVAVNRFIAKPRKVTEAGTAWGSIAKAAVSVAKKYYGSSGPSSGKTVGSSISGGIVPRTKSVQKWESRAKRVSKNSIKQYKRGGQQPSYTVVSTRGAGKVRVTPRVGAKFAKKGK